MHFLKNTLFFTLVLILSNISYAQVILIDPGHGGDDCGARTKKTDGKKVVSEICEKDVALSFAKKIHEKLSPHFTTYLTRSVDRTVTLEERAELAEKIKATLFISVHINSSEAKSSHGYETFYLDNHNNIAVRKVEQVENRNAKGEEVVINQILTDLVIERTAPESKALATVIHQQINKDVQKRFKLIDRGMKPALFYVLALSKRPAVLLEPGFLSNSSEMNKILSEDFQEAYSNAVATGIINFYKSKNKARPSLF